MMDRITPQQWALNLAAISAGALGAAFIAQYAFGLAPCELCIYQRIPYAVIVALGLLGAFASPKYTRALLIGIAGALAIECAMAVFHVGVEQKWWAGLDTCNINVQGASVDDIRERILNAPRALCSDVAWSLFGISMAGYNALLSLGLFVATTLHLKR